MSGNSESMIRAVASAIAHVDGCDLEVALSEREAYEIKARAAIEAMREPTEAMLTAAGNADAYWHHDVSEVASEWRDEMRVEWQAMIEAALGHALPQSTL